MRASSCVGRAYATTVLTLTVLTKIATADAAAPTPFADGLTGNDIYSKIIENRFRSFSQESKLISADRTGRSQESRFNMRWQDFRDENGDAPRGIMSKTLVKYSHPFDIRHSGYLIQANKGRSNDQFIYYPSRRRVVRVNLRNQSIYGTDFSFEDVIPREAEDFAYRRLADATVEAVPVFVLELYPKEFTDSEYSKIEVKVDKERFVILRSRYWDQAEVEIKRFSAETAGMKQFEGVWVAMKSRMQNLLLGSYTELIVTEVVANPDFPSNTFDLGRLESH